MESLDQAVCFMDDLLDFDFASEEDDDEENNNKNNKPAAAFLSLASNASSSSPSFNVLNNGLHADSAHSLPDFVEEELEWLSNKDAFPSVETFAGILSQELLSSSKHRSPVSVLESGTASSTSSSTAHSSTNDIVTINHCWSFHIPVKMRSKQHRRRRRDFGGQHCSWSQENLKKMKVVKTSTIGRKCQHCGSEKTPQWRAGPFGPKTLCNACGVRFKSGRLVPEYRPANSPTFCTIWHSNSHRKVLEMRKQKQMMGIMVVKAMEKV